MNISIIGENIRVETIDIKEIESNRVNVKIRVHPTAKREETIPIKIGRRKFLIGFLDFSSRLSVSSDMHIIPSVANADNQSEISNADAGENKMIRNTAIVKDVKLSRVLAIRNRTLQMISIIPALVMEGVKPTIAI